MHVTKKSSYRSFKQGTQDYVQYATRFYIYNVEIIPGTGAKLVRSAEQVQFIIKKKVSKSCVLRLKRANYGWFIEVV